MTFAEIESALGSSHFDAKEAKQLRALEQLHDRARRESTAAASDGSWTSLERRLFGDPSRRLSLDEEHGLGFSASLMDGPSVDLVTLSGIPLAPGAEDLLWDNHSWQSILDGCSAAERFEMEGEDGVPGMSDAVYWIVVHDPCELARQLRTVIADIVADS